jgi:transposase, IS30 family
MEKYTHITDSERRKIEASYAKGKSIRSIAQKLGRSPNSISYEIGHNSSVGTYTRNKARQKARIRRKRAKLQCLKVATDSKLKEYVTEHIKDDQSPCGVSGRLKNVEVNIQYASAKAIYKFIHSVHGRKIEKHLYSNAVKKKGGPKRGTHKPRDDGRTMIDKRPKKVDKRLEFGHFEGDFIESGKDGHGSLLVLVERKTRYPFIVYTDDRTTKHINTLIGNLLSGIPIKSITLDNDISFQKHEELSELIEAAVFYCHSYCSHEKGTVENRNKAVRRYAPKRTDFSLTPRQKIEEIEGILRTRFMKCLGYHTPEEAWKEEMEKWRKNQKPVIVRTLKKCAGAHVVGH